MSDRVFALADLFELVAESVPDREALVAGDVRLTFAQLDERANRLANHLLEGGIRPGGKVAIYAWNRAEWVESLLAAYKARAVAININYRYVADELRYVLENADVEVVIVERASVPVLDQVRADLPLLREVIVIEDDYEKVLAAASPERPRLIRSPDDLYMLYTGGTTGMPKGVMWRQEDIFFAALGGGGFGQPPITTPEEIVERIWPEDGRVTSLVIAPVMHGAAQWGMCITLFGGGKVVMYTAHGFDPHEAWRLVERERCVNVMVVGDAIARPMADALEDGTATYDLSSLAVIGSGGALFSPSVKEQLRRHIPNLIAMDTFGASELGASGSQPDAASGPRFLPNAQTAVLGDDLMPLPPGTGEVGRLARKGHIPLGYYKDEAKTAATFVTGPDGTRWAVPGDYAVVEADGTVTLLGRGSGCINTGGEKVYPEEVELALKSHPGVFDALVVGLPDQRFGERVAAVVHPRPGFDLTLEDLDAHCRTAVAGYKVPRELKLVEAIGRTASGKADYKWAKEQFSA